MRNSSRLSLHPHDLRQQVQPRFSHANKFVVIIFSLHLFSQRIYRNLFQQVKVILVTFTHDQYSHIDPTRIPHQSGIGIRY